MTDIASSIQRTAGKRLVVTICASLIAFLAYSSVYAYRKPFTVATFEGIGYWNISYQTLLIISQVIGYMLSKFAGIKFIAELRSLGRFRTGIIRQVQPGFACLDLDLCPHPGACCSCSSMVFCWALCGV